MRASMKAVRAAADGSVDVVEMGIPTAGPGEAVMRLSAAGICGSDLLAWYVRGKAGTVLGHEIAGQIVSVGEGVAEFAPGDRIVPHHHAPCLECAACRAGRFVHCPVWRASRLDPGGMAEWVRVPAENLSRDTLRIPDGVSDEAACWTEPLATVVKAFARGRFSAGQSALVVGLGSAGQLAVRVAASRGASRIVGADRIASRMAIARASGAHETIDVSGEGLADGARRASESRGFDFVFVGPGKTDAIRAAAESVAAGGTLLLFSMAAPEETLTLSPHDLYFREVSVIPSYSSGPDDTRAALDLIASRRIAVDDLVTHRFPIEQAVDAFARARQPEGSVKVLITGSGETGNGKRETENE